MFQHQTQSEYEKRTGRTGWNGIVTSAGKRCETMHASCSATRWIGDDSEMDDRVENLLSVSRKRSSEGGEKWFSRMMRRSRLARGTAKRGELGGSRRSSRVFLSAVRVLPSASNLRFRTYVNVTLFPSIHPRAKRGKREEGRGVVALFVPFAPFLSLSNLFADQRTTVNVLIHPRWLCDFCCKELEGTEGVCVQLARAE